MSPRLEVSSLDMLNSIKSSLDKKHGEEFIKFLLDNYWLSKRFYTLMYLTFSESGKICIGPRSEAELGPFMQEAANLKSCDICRKLIFRSVLLGH